MSRHLGLIIGVNHYQDSTFRPLHFAENDAKALAQWLVNSKGGKWSPPDVQLVQGQHATRELVESLITQLCTKVAEPGDIVLIYFAGHAFLDVKTGDGYLALANTDAQDAASGFSLRTFVHNILPQSRAAHILCVLDIFQTGPLWNMRRSSPFDTKPFFGPAILSTLQYNRLFLCSCRGNDFAPEAGERNIGTFVYRMIIGLGGPASETSTGNVTLPKLHAYLLNVVGEQHRPQLFGQQQPPLILVGEPSLPAATQGTDHDAKTPAPRPSPTPGLQPGTTGLLKPKIAQRTTIATQAPPLSPGPSTSGRIFAPALEEHRQQQCQHMVAQAQQFLQSQQYGAAFDTVEKALQMAPHNTSALVLKGQLLSTAGRFQEAFALIEQILQADPNNAIGWSMRAVVLNKMGQYQLALTAIERSLELDPTHETTTIKANIMANLAGEQSKNHSASVYHLPTSGQEPQIREHPRAFFIGVGLHLLGFICGIAGVGLLIFSHLPSPIGLLVASLGLAIVCVSATRDAFRYGFSRLLLTLFVSLMIGGLCGAVYKLGYTSITNSLSNDTTPTRLLQFLFLAIWIIAAATIPLVLATGGCVGGWVVRAHRRR